MHFKAPTYRTSDPKRPTGTNTPDNHKPNSATTTGSSCVKRAELARYKVAATGFKQTFWHIVCYASPLLRASTAACEGHPTWIVDSKDRSALCCTISGLYDLTLQIGNKELEPTVRQANNRCHVYRAKFPFAKALATFAVALDGNIILAALAPPLTVHTTKGRSYSSRTDNGGFGSCDVGLDAASTSTEGRPDEPMLAKNFTYHGGEHLDLATVFAYPFQSQTDLLADQITNCITGAVAER
jgi:hypothetical protein